MCNMMPIHRNDFSKGAFCRSLAALRNLDNRPVNRLSWGRLNQARHKKTKQD